MPGNVRVGIIDSGVSPRDAVLSAAITEEVAFGPARSDSECPTEDSASEDESWHGTTCARIIAAIAPTAEFYVAKVLDSRNQGFGTDLVAALQWLADKRVDVVNLSVGTRNATYLEPLIAVVNRLNAQNTVLVSAGLCDVLYPASIPSVISVIRDRLYSTLRRDAIPALKIDFAVTPDEHIDQTCIRTDVIGCQSDFASSFAVPYVTGLAALVRQSHPSITWAQMRSVLSVATDDGTLLNFRDNPFLKKTIAEHAFRLEELKAQVGH